MEWSLEQVETFNAGISFLKQRHDSVLMQFGIAILILLAFLAARKFILDIILSRFKKWTEKTKNINDDLIFAAIKGPAGLIFYTLGALTALSVFSLEGMHRDISKNIIDSTIIFSLFWFAYGLTEPLSLIYKNISKNKKISSSFYGFILKSLKLTIIILGTISILQEWGYNVMGFIASIGLVGMVIALAAKDTVANLFGTLSIIMDDVMENGDWIETAQVEGTVETIGLRCSKIRTFANALVTLPNSHISNNAVINWSRMNHRRIKMVIGLEYQTDSATLQKVIADIRQYLKENDDICTDGDTMCLINLHHFNESSIDIFLYFFTFTTNWQKYMDIRQECLFKFMHIVESYGASFAFPSQSIYIHSTPKDSLASPV